MDNDTLKKKLHTIFKTYQDLYSPQSREKVGPLAIHLPCKPNLPSSGPSPPKP